METLEFKKIFKSLYSPKPGKPEIVTVPRMQFAMVDGKGDPNTSQEFQDAVSALYSTTYGLKFSRKKEGKLPDFTIGALEGLWWSNKGKMFEIGEKSDWLWTVMIWVPEIISQAEFAEQVELAQKKKPNPALKDIRLEYFEEGEAVQIMHIGPYADEKRSVDLMHAFIAEKGYAVSGKHHEIYLGDPRRTKPEKLKTILRHPIKKLG